MLKGMKYLFLIAILLCHIPLCSTNALTITNPTEHEKAAYRISYGGMALGKIWLWWEADEQYYKITASIKTSGLVRLFNTQQRLAEVTGKHEAGRYTPIHYHASVTYPHKSRTTDMSYEDFHLKDIVSQPPRTVHVTDEQLSQAVDPLTAILQLLLFMREPIEAEELYAMPIFDGKRLMRGYAHPYHPPSPDCMLPCRTYALYRKPLAGYSLEDMKEYSLNDPPILLQHNPAISHFPQRLEATSTLGVVRVERIDD